MDLEQGLESIHLLKQSPSSISAISESSVPTVVGSPSPDLFRRSFQFEGEHMAGRNVPVESPSAALSGIATEPRQTEGADSFGMHRSPSLEGQLHRSVTHIIAWEYEESSTNPTNYERPTWLLKPLPRSKSPDWSRATGMGDAHTKSGSAKRQAFSGCDPLTQKDKGTQNFLYSFAIAAIAVYSTVMSGLWLVVGASRLTWSAILSSDSGPSLSDVSSICTFLAKSIELSFATLFVTFLGQKLSRRAYFDRSKGISLAEMSMRSWILQPGSIVTHRKIVKYAGQTRLGLLSIFSTSLAIFYTSASDTLGELSPDFFAISGNLSLSRLYINLYWVAMDAQLTVSSFATPISKSR